MFGDGARRPQTRMLARVDGGSGSSGDSLDGADTNPREYAQVHLSSTKLRALAAAIKVRWIREQADQELSEPALITLKADPWQGLRRHALITMIAPPAIVAAQ